MCTIELPAGQSVHAPVRGFTLIELIIFIVVVSAALAGILSVMNTTVKASADPLVRKQAVAIAESLLEEIMLKAYANPAGGYSGADRTQFDDVSDYHGYVTSTGVLDAQGNAVPALAAYNVSPAVDVTAVSLDGLAVQRITVSVTGPHGTVALTGYRANY